MTVTGIFLIFIAGIFPAILWLLFWLREDRLHPEPRRLIALSFLLGMLAIPLAYIGQKEAIALLPHGPLLILVWAAIEEVLKFGAAFVGTHMAWKYYDEPIDAVIYIITAALGFAALENVLFLHTDFTLYGVVEGLRTSNLRFIGASLLHILSSGIVGVSLAFAFYKPKYVRAVTAITGLVLGTAVHTIFNVFLLDSRYQDKAFYIFCAVWIAIILLLVIFEKIKQLKTYDSSPQM